MDTKQTAIILVGYQNDYFAADGILRGVIEEANRVDLTLSNTVDLLTFAAKSDMTIVSTPIILTSDYRGLAESVGILGAIKESGAFKAGSPGAETIPEIQAFGNRILYVNGKQGFNGFSNTELDRVLAERGIKRLLLAGMITSLCIDSTGRAAYERGYRVTIVSDCVSARTPAEQEFYCQNIFPLYADVMDSHQIVSEIASTVTV
ncbi:MAG: cysteine hydrolase [Fimbriimonas sp.]|nr:cysteine hydrolase [Fimbriimonas sp.]